MKNQDEKDMDDCSGMHVALGSMFHADMSTAPWEPSLTQGDECDAEPYHACAGEGIDRVSVAAVCRAVNRAAAIEI